MSSADGFPGALRAWRARVGVSQAELDRRIGRTTGTIAQTELGRLQAPDRAGCARIAEALGVPEREVWITAREDRLRRFDAEIYQDIQAEREAAKAPLTLLEDERDLIQILRAVDTGSGGPPGACVRALADVALLVQTDVGTLETAGTWALARAASLPQPRLKMLLSAMVRVVETVVDERAAKAGPGAR